MQGKSAFNLPSLEEKILGFWEENKIFEKSLERTKKGKRFVFFEGPPTANGLPHIGHALSRAFKDIILRYKTMRGFYVPRKAGWDTHGLPVEIEVEKILGFKSKRDIEKYGIARFNQKAKESVWRYKDEWEKSTKRLGFWLDLEHPYITYDTAYIETLWWIIKEIWKKGLLYQDFKVIPWCPRCQTGLSSHEVGLGYKKIKEDSIYVKLKLKNKTNEYLLIWTTTPWTLPANVAVALNPQTEYTKYKIKGEYLWSARTPPYETPEKISVVEKASGRSLLGIKYEPLFRVPKECSLGGVPEFATIAGEFISLEEGTGMVHIAPAFGDEDMETAKRMWRGSYPILHTVNTDGTMKKGVIGEKKFVKDADKLIIEDLKRRGLLYAAEPYEHDYPFCWRCSTPLLYFAKTAWWIKMRDVKKKLIENNGRINWIPSHLKTGRFGEFLADIRDWAFSRERFWGTPLPVWRCDKCDHQEVIGGREELARRAGPARNRFFLMRHGEALSNVKNIVSYAPDGKYRETLRGLVQDERAAKKLKKIGIDFIYTSDVLRTKQTAEIVGGVLGLKPRIDTRLHELNAGDLEGRHPDEYHSYFSFESEKFTKRPPGGENLTEVRKRMLEVVEELEQKHSGKTILLISHEHPLWLLYAGSIGLTNEETLALRSGSRREEFIHFAEVMELPYVRLPRDENGEVDLHRPYADSFKIPCGRCDGLMKRVTEVIDAWFDSGSMPFAQAHRPFGDHLPFTSYQSQYPADYICEGVDQTRGWFYTLLAVATLLGKPSPYKNVISLGHVLDKSGQKMSKSKGNVVNPGEIIKKYGADTLRWYFYTINSPGEPKRFDEKDLMGKLRGFLMTFWNCFVLFDTYVDKIRNLPRTVPEALVRGSKFPGLARALPRAGEIRNSKNVLDRWVLAKLEILERDVTMKLDAYDITGAGRVIEEFVINDFSQWYLRRSRRRFQRPESKEIFAEAAETTAQVLYQLLRISAPFVPFLAETIYQELRKKLKLKETSIHLVGWPILLCVIPRRKPRNLTRSFAPYSSPRVIIRGFAPLRMTAGEKKILGNMEEVRKIVADALRLRAAAEIKVRQPLASLQIRNPKFEIRNEKELLDLIRDEVNVKKVAFGVEFKLETTLTPELKEEGVAREIIRNIQEMRRGGGFHPADLIFIQIAGSEATGTVIERWQQFIQKETNSRKVIVGGKKIFKIEREIIIDGLQLWIGIR